MDALLSNPTYCIAGLSGKVIDLNMITGKLISELHVVVTPNGLERELRY